MSSDFMPLSLDSVYSANPYTAKNGSLTAEDLEKMGYEVSNPNDNFGLDFTDFLQLMVAQLQNQTIDSAADTSDMLNQLVQMSVVGMMSTVKSSLENLTSASTLTYAASLVGKTVTVGAYDENGEIKEIVGEVTGTGTYQGMPVIFIGDDMYALNSIMAVGRLPQLPEEGGEGEGGEGGSQGGSTTPPEESTQSV